MNTPAWVVLALLCAVVGVSYALIYPRVAGSNPWTMAKCDLVLVAVIGLTVWLIYGRHGQRFEVLGMDLHWALYTVVAWLVVELPVYSWYVNKYGVLDELRQALDPDQAQDKH